MTEHNTFGPDPDNRCPICNVECVPGADGKIPHDQAAHDRRKAEDWKPQQKLDKPELPKPGLYDPPGDPTIPSYVRSLMERRPDLKDDILREYQAGLRGEKLEADPAPQLPLPRAEPELQRPRRPFGYGPDD